MPGVTRRTKQSLRLASERALNLERRELAHVSGSQTRKCFVSLKEVMGKVQKKLDDNSSQVHLKSLQKPCWGPHLARRKNAEGLRPTCRHAEICIRASVARSPTFDPEFLLHSRHAKGSSDRLRCCGNPPFTSCLNYIVAPIILHHLRCTTFFTPFALSTLFAAVSTMRTGD